MPSLLPTAAAANAAHVKSQARTLVAGGPSRLAGFYAVATMASAGSAVQAFKLDLIDAAGGILSAREMVAAVRGLSDPHEVEMAFADSQPDWYAARLAFEDHWQDGRQFVYTALILEGLGLPEYGPYTLLVDDPPGCQGCFPGNTAARYVKGGTLDVALCESEAAPWPNRGDLLTVKHSSTVPVDRLRWPTLVLSRTGFSEALWVAPINLDLVSEVRVDEAEYKRWRQLRKDFRNGAVLNAANLRDVKALDVLTSWRSQYGTRIVAV